MQALTGLPGAQASVARAINDKGVAIGSSASNAGAHAVIWGAQGIQDLGVLPGDIASEALAINNAGMVVGYSRGASGLRAFIWTAAGGMQNLPPLPRESLARALGVNDAGQIVGSSGGSHDVSAVIWNGGGTPIDLNGLATLPTGVVLQQAVGINAKGQIAALGKDESNGHGHEGYDRIFLLTPIGP
jgi:probable HAF family extracellular repeat protein